MELIDETPDLKKQRHGCVTAWLVIMIIFNSIATLIYFFESDLILRNLPKYVTYTSLVLLGSFGIINVISAILLLKWIKLGFWGFIISGVCVYAINVNNGMGVFQPLSGILGVLVLYGILQIKQKETSAWSNLD